jgi:hypothetical protein
MSLNNFIPQIWSAQLLANLRKSLVFGQEGVVNKNYEGEISGFGSSVRINSIGAITIGDYTKNGTINLQQLDDETQVLNIDQQKYFNFMIDDIDKAQQNPKVMGQAMSDAAYGLRDKADQYIAGLFNGAADGIGGSGGVQVTSSTIYEQLTDLGVLLDEQNAPSEGRWVILPPWVHGKLAQDEKFIATGSAQAEDRLVNGMVGRAAGFNIFASNNVKKEVVTGTDVWRIMAGTNQAISFAEQIMSVEAFRPEGRFADAVKGLYVYGAKVVRSECLVVLNAKK